MPEPSITLRDAFSVYNTQLELIMKLYTFLQVVTVAVSGFMWTVGKTIPHTPVVVGFSLFALGNGLLLLLAYRDWKCASLAIRNYKASHRDEIPDELSPVLSTFETCSGWLLVIIHIFVDTIAIGAITQAK
ncbi:MAG TPA: hypothetical protein VNN08_22925 [Thermoanaerobaculia bacterium]|nr:hypothetical protein [Thermoanaerobaculia bacterium]